MEGHIFLTPNEHGVAEDRRDCYGLYIVTDCGQARSLPVVGYFDRWRAQSGLD